MPLNERLALKLLTLAAVALFPIAFYYVNGGGHHHAQLFGEYSYISGDSSPPEESQSNDNRGPDASVSSQIDNLQAEGKITAYNFSRAVLHRKYAFSSDSPLDVLVFLHMQKTGGTTFGKNLIWNLDVRNPCQCSKNGSSGLLRCPCYTSDGLRQWLFSRYSTGWVCGLHADFTGWTECLADGVGDKVEGFHRVRRYLMITVLREPKMRYVSEWMHTSRGATWHSASYRCNGQELDRAKLPLCFTNETWEGVTLPEFLDCPYNLATNRQTRMLANLSLVDCYEQGLFTDPIKKQKLLASAKENLANLAFFGLKNYPNETQYLFEQTFGIKFSSSISDIVPKTIHSTQDYFETLKPEIQLQIEQKNDLDIQLYDYALQLFKQRYKYARSIDHT